MEEKRIMQTTVVQPPCGPLMGEKADGLVLFHAVPYAAPPTGEMRWRLPAAHKPWTAARDAVKAGPIFPQGPSDLERPMGPFVRSMSEDALTLEITAPEHAENLPVVVWFHGGANITGAGSLDWYSGRVLAKEGRIVFVAVNYRLGAFGFLYLPGVVDPNIAASDQRFALQWVKQNISAFGGNPDNVTIIGQSAGGNACAVLLADPQADGLFRRAWMMSASLGRGNHTPEDAEMIGRAFVEAAGLNPDADKAELGCALRALSVEEVLRAADAAAAVHGPAFQTMIFKGVSSAAHAPKDFERLAAEGAKAKGAEVVIGLTRDETLAFSEDRSPEALEKLRQAQELRFDGPDLEFARMLVKLGVPVHKYSFDWVAPNAHYGACHCIDIPFLFGAWDAWKSAPMLAGGRPDDMEALGRQMREAFFAFVRGEPMPADWPGFDAHEFVRHFL